MVPGASISFLNWHFDKWVVYLLSLCDCLSGCLRLLCFCGFYISVLFLWPVGWEVL